ncbi:MAG: hypothetical protein RPV21_03175 [Candidatus Sedimenticola sp. (ex Thyasira tokunagai)]
MIKFKKLLLCFFLSTSLTVIAEEAEQTYGDWEVGSFIYNKTPFSFANTTNDSNSTLGVICMESSDTCMPYVVNRLSCENDGKYPALVSIDGGIASIEMSCLIIEDRYLFLLPDSQLDYILTSNSFGIAFGTNIGKFKAAYFSLAGSAKAVIAAKLTIDAIPSSKSKSSSDKESSNFKDTVL